MFSTIIDKVVKDVMEPESKKCLCNIVVDKIQNQIDATIEEVIKQTIVDQESQAVTNMNKAVANRKKRTITGTTRKRQPKSINPAGVNQGIPLEAVKPKRTRTKKPKQSVAVAPTTVSTLPEIKNNE